MRVTRTCPEIKQTNHSFDLSFLLRDSNFFLINLKRGKNLLNEKEGTKSV